MHPDWAYQWGLAKEMVRGSAMVTDWVRAMEMVNEMGSARASEWVSGSTRWRSGTNQREEAELPRIESDLAPERHRQDHA